MFLNPYKNHLINLKDIKNILFNIKEEIDFPEIKNIHINIYDNIQNDNIEYKLIEFAKELKLICDEIKLKVEKKIHYLEEIVANPQSFEIDDINLKKNYNSRTNILEINWIKVKRVINYREKQINGKNLNTLNSLKKLFENIIFQNKRLDEIFFDLTD